MHQQLLSSSLAPMEKFCAVETATVLHRIYIRCRSFILYTPFPIFSKSGRKLFLTQVVLLDISYTSYKKWLKSIEPLRRSKQNCAADALSLAMMTKIFGLVSTISSTHRWQHARLLLRQVSCLKILSLGSTYYLWAPVSSAWAFVAALCCDGVGHFFKKFIQKRSQRRDKYYRYHYEHKINPTES